MLRSIGSLFGWIWIGAALASVYFLYGALANEAPIRNLIWSIGAGLMAKHLNVVLHRNKQRVDYVDQLLERGYTHGEAATAWEIANNDGSNLLLNLQQAETIAKADLADFESSHGNAENSDT
jgi:hypothetical protein